jgi:hypothetical protein
MKDVSSLSQYLKRRSVGCLLLLWLLPGCAPKVKKQVPVFNAAYLSRSYNQIEQSKRLIQSGDIIFRNGNDEVSEAARRMNRKDSSWSHCGIILIENDSIMVYHALGGTYNPDMKLLREPLVVFCNPKENLGFGVYRYELDTAQFTKMQQTVYRHYRDGLRFDLFFNFETDDVMYCSEFVFKTLNKSLQGKLSPYLRIDTIPYGVTTDDLFLNPDCKPVTREKFIP